MIYHLQQSTLLALLLLSSALLMTSCTNKKQPTKQEEIIKVAKMTPEERKQYFEEQEQGLAAMTPEERKQYFEKQEQEYIEIIAAVTPEEKQELANAKKEEVFAMVGSHSISRSLGLLEDTLDNETIDDKKRSAQKFLEGLKSTYVLHQQWLASSPTLLGELETNLNSFSAKATELLEQENFKTLAEQCREYENLQEATTRRYENEISWIDVLDQMTKTELANN